MRGLAGAGPAVLHGAEEGRDALLERMAAAPRLSVLTGAGLSTECGVPDFRSPGSPWLVNKPLPYAAFMADKRVRAEAWRRKFRMDDEFKGATPGRGHLALARLVERGRLERVVTQNIDNLHQDAGTPPERVIELHGNGTYARCQACGLRHELAPLRAAFERDGEPPVCAACGGPVKSATISFGQAMPEAETRAAIADARRADLYLAIGSSLVVYPAASLPAIAKAAGARLVILNREPTDLDEIADLVIRADVGDVLEGCGEG